MRISREYLWDFIVDTTLANAVSMSFILPFYYVIGMDTSNLVMVFWSFWTIGWPTSLAIVGALRMFRDRYPYRSKGGTTDVTYS